MRAKAVAVTPKAQTPIGVGISKFWAHSLQCLHLS